MHGSRVSITILAELMTGAGFAYSNALKSAELRGGNIGGASNTGNGDEIEDKWVLLGTRVPVSARLQPYGAVHLKRQANELTRVILGYRNPTSLNFITSDSFISVHTICISLHRSDNELTGCYLVYPLSNPIYRPRSAFTSSLML